LEEAWRTRVAGMLHGLPVWFINRDLLIQNKRVSGRDQDLADIRLLEKTRKTE